jgi:hypothetical protein
MNAQVERDPAPQYAKLVTHISTIQTALDAVNNITGVPKQQKPTLPTEVFSRADALKKTDVDVPLRVLSLGRRFERISAYS